MSSSEKVVAQLKITSFFSCYFFVCVYESNKSAQHIPLNREGSMCSLAKRNLFGSRDAHRVALHGWCFLSRDVRPSARPQQPTCTHWPRHAGDDARTRLSTGWRRPGTSLHYPVAAVGPGLQARRGGQRRTIPPRSGSSSGWRLLSRRAARLSHAGNVLVGRVLSVIL